MKVAAVQMDIAWHDRPVNHDKAKRLAAQAREAGADLLVLPEMFSTGFSMDTSITPEPLEGATPTLLRTLARDLDMVVVGGFVLERDNGGPQNVSLAVDRNGNDLALYAKIHQIGLLGEDGSYDPGDWPVVFKLEEMNATCFVCYDLRFPELFRAVVDQCGLILVIASWPAARQSHWDLLLRARAVESQCFVVGVNRVGIHLLFQTPGLITHWLMPSSTMMATIQEILNVVATSLATVFTAIAMILYYYDIRLRSEEIGRASCRERV